MSADKITVSLRVYKGDANGEQSYKPDGKGGFVISSENQKMTLTYGDTEWLRHLSNLPKMGFSKVVVEKVFQGNTEVEMPEIAKEVDAVYKPKERELSPQEQRIADLEAKIEALTKGATKTPIEPKAPDNDEALDALRAEFKEKAGKEAHKLWGEKRLSEEIAKLNN